MDIKTFQALPTVEVAKLVSKHGPKVCVLPFNGTRRWFMVEQKSRFENKNYIELSIQKTIEILQVIFDHGIKTLLSPLLGQDILERANYDNSYVSILQNFALIATHPAYLNFYKTYKVKVGFYGDYKRQLKNTKCAHLIDLYENLTNETKKNNQHRLYLGLFGNDATENIGEISLDFYKKHNRLPNRKEIVTAYYGEYIDPVDIFIGADKPTAFDMPLIAIGHEDLYFTVVPSFYLNAKILRDILYDHIYSRKQVNDMYQNISLESIHALKDFYKLNMEQVLGVGNLSLDKSFWYPTSRIKIPKSLAKYKPEK